MLAVASLLTKIAAAHVARRMLAACPTWDGPDVVEDKCKHHTQCPVFFAVSVVHLQVHAIRPRRELGQLFHDGKEHLLVVLAFWRQNAEHPDRSEHGAQHWRPI
jgi:hypothetical protein